MSMSTPLDKFGSFVYAAAHILARVIDLDQGTSRSRELSNPHLALKEAS